MPKGRRFEPEKELKLTRSFKNLTGLTKQHISNNDEARVMNRTSEPANWIPIVISLYTKLICLLSSSQNPSFIMSDHLLHETWLISASPMP